MAAAMTEGAGPRSTQWARKYPPLLILAAAALIVLAVLPSSLNLPQTNPSQTLEYAPVPPDDETPPPPMPGNLASLGLAGSSSLEQSLATTTTTLLEEVLGGGTDPRGRPKVTGAKDCVGDPPKQTEDPLAPPCVVNFEGDNFGSTYQGVTREEIQILVYFEGYTNYTTCSRGGEVTPDGEYFDLMKEGKPDDHCMVRILRGWQQYFNDRYQTYGRIVHFHAFFATGGLNPSAASRKADAADNYAKLKPFAVLSYAVENNDAYLESMARKGVLNFGALAARPADFFNRFPRLIWGYYPTVEQQAKMFSSYVCTKVAPYRVSFSGNPADMGDERRYGLWYTSDKDRPELRLLKDLVKQQVEACGVRFVAEETFPSSQYVQDNSNPPQYASDANIAFQQAGVTTIIWPGGLETNLSRTSGNYKPELVVAGDLFLEGNGEGQYQEAGFWSHAWVVSHVVHIPLIDDSLCYKAYVQVNAAVPKGDLRYSCKAGTYEDLRQLFTGIQVAGPRLGPTSIDKGFRAIPKIESNNRQTPACFYDAGDYTCTKDAIAEWWDPNGDSPNNDQPGCWRMAADGARYLNGKWPAGDVATHRTAADRCNGYNGNGLINPNAPDLTP